MVIAKTTTTTVALTKLLFYFDRDTHGQVYKMKVKIQVTILAATWYLTTVSGLRFISYVAKTSQSIFRHFSFYCMYEEQQHKKDHRLNNNFQIEISLCVSSYVCAFVNALDCTHMCACMRKFNACVTFRCSRNISRNFFGMRHRFDEKANNIRLVSL